MNKSDRLKCQREIRFEPSFKWLSGGSTFDYEGNALPQVRDNHKNAGLFDFKYRAENSQKHLLSWSEGPGSWTGLQVAKDVESSQTMTDFVDKQEKLESDCKTNWQPLERS